jgi:RecA-family ATPase
MLQQLLQRGDAGLGKGYVPLIACDLVGLGEDWLGSGCNGKRRSVPEQTTHGLMM